jgi:exoribonuclease-2
MNCLNFQVKKCLIQVDENLSYDAANSYLTDSRNLDEINALKKMYEVSMRINSQDDSIDDYRKIKGLKSMIFSDEKKLDSLSSSMIVNYMVFLNSFLAEFFSKHPEVPFIYRNNLIGFSERSLKKIKEIIKGNYNYKDILEYAKILNSPSFYSIYNEGHKKLKIPAYSHVTNPLRNYASLETQRLIEKYLINNDFTTTPDDIERLEALCKYLNMRMQMNDEYYEKIEELELRRQVKLLTK